MTAIANNIVEDVGFAALALGATALYMAAVFLLLTTVFDQAALDKELGFSKVFGTAVGVMSQGYLVALVLIAVVEGLRSGSKAVVLCFLQVRSGEPNNSYFPGTPSLSLICRMHV